MPRNPFGIGPVGFGFGPQPEKKKRVNLTSKERLYVWEHPKLYGRTCNICGQKITKQSDMELDHTVPHCKGGTKMALAHRECNRMKGSKSLRHVQKKMGLKTKEKAPKKKAKRAPRGEYAINPFTGRKERVQPLFRF